MAQAFFVTGTDTEIGKTTIAAGFLHAARQQGFSTAAVKPVAAGCERTAEGLRNDDALTLQAECKPTLAYDLINPVALEAAIAPHIAASESGVTLTAAGLLEGCQPVLQQQADLTLIEGAGGWLVPLSGNETLADLATGLQLPVILVVGMRLGCINHALLTAKAVQDSGLRLAGWVANQVDPQMSRPQENLATLQQLMSAPCLGVVPSLAEPSAAAVASHLQLADLMSSAAD